MTIEKAIYGMTHTRGTMQTVWKNIYAYLTGKVGKTPLKFMPGYTDSTCRHIYRKVKGVTVETVIDPDTNKVLYTGAM